MSAILDGLETLVQTVRKPQKTTEIIDWEEAHTSLLQKYNEVVTGNNKLAQELAALSDQSDDLARYERLGQFILDNAALLQNSGLAVTSEKNGLAATSNESATRETGVVLDLTDGKPKKYYAVLNHGEDTRTTVYLSSIPDKMSKHNLAKKYHAYFTGTEDQQRAFRTIRSLETGNPILTVKSQKRIFWVCADAISTWECTCLDQLAKTKRNQVAATKKQETVDRENDQHAKETLAGLKSLGVYGSTVETPPIEVETPPAAFTAYDSNRGTEVEFYAARRTARMMTNRGEKWAGMSGRGIPYSKIINHGLSIGFTLEQMSQVG